MNNTTITPLAFTEDILDAEQLFVDPRIQRELVSRQIASMSNENYRSESVGTLVVSKRPNGRYAILDGQHRWTVVKEQDPKLPLRCQVFTNLTEEDEAELFLLYNNQSVVNAVAKFKAGVRAGRPVPVAVWSVLDKYGLEVGNGFHYFNSVYTAMKISTWRDGLELLDRAVDIATRAWTPMARPEYGAAGLDNLRGNSPWRGSTLEGLARVAHRYGIKLNDAHMVEQLVALGSRGPQRIATDAVQVRASFGRLLISEATALVLVKVYNTGAGGRRLDKWAMDIDDDLGGATNTATFNDLVSLNQAEVS